MQPKVFIIFAFVIFFILIISIILLLIDPANFVPSFFDLYFFEDLIALGFKFKFVSVCVIYLVWNLE